MSDYQGNIIIKNPATPTGPSETGSAPGIWSLNEALAFKRQGIWPTQGVQGRDPYFNYVSMLLSSTSLGNANNNLFVDSSGAFNPISRNGNTTQGSFTPYSPNWGVYFNGSSTLTFAQQTLDADFTIEAWVYYNENTTQPTLIGRNGGSPLANDQALRRVLVSGNGRQYFYDYATGFQLTGTINIQPFTWTHLAVARSGSTLRMFTNGVLDNSGTWTGSFDYFCVGGVDTSNDRLNGYASNVRVVDGTAVYTASFTPPTTPLTAIAGTELLVCQSNRFRDASTNNFALTVNGAPQITDYSPFSSGSAISYNQSDIQYWSGYFDGSGDYLLAPSNAAFAYGTGDFTIECWGYRRSSSDFWCGYSSNGISFTLFSYAGGNIQVYSSGFYDSGINPGYGNWFHVAVTRSSGTMRIYVNGVLGFSGSYTTNITQHSVNIGMSTAGETGVGYVSNLRVVKGTAVYTGASLTVPTTPLTAIANTSLLTCQNAAFTDNSTNNLAIGIFGNTAVTGNSPFGPTGFWSLSGTSTQGATIPQTTATNLGSGSFTVECWVNATAFDGGVVTKRRTDTALTGSWGIFIDANGYLNFQGVGWASSYTASTNPVPRGAWTHLAVSRSGTNLSMYVNGTRVINTTDSYDYTCSTYTIIKLAGNSGGNYPSGGALFGGITGSLSNLRIVQGVAVYNPASATITVPTSPLTAINSTSLLTCQNGTMKDNSTNNNTSILLYNGGSLQSFDPFYTSTIASNGGSMYFDGTGDFLTNPASPNWIFAGDYTLEAWVYPMFTGSYAHIFGTGGPGSNDQWAFAPGVGNGSIAWAYSAVGSTYLTTTATIPPYAWTHLVVSRSSNTLRAFVNGAQVFSGTMSTTVGQNATNYIGRRSDGVNAMSGYLAGLNITNGTARYTAAFTPPTAPANPIATTVLLGNGMNAGIYDATAINDLETVGDAQVNTAVSKFGGSSMAFDGNGDYLLANTATTDLYSFGAGDFTIECWAYVNSISTYGGLVDTRSAITLSNYVLGVWATSGNRLDFIYGTTRVTSASTFSTGQWVHFAVTRASGTIRLFINGNLDANTATFTGAINCSRTQPIIGAVQDPYFLNGYLDDFRITKGVARYTANFTPPTQAFPPY